MTPNPRSTGWSRNEVIAVAGVAVTAIVGLLGLFVQNGGDGGSTLPTQPRIETTTTFDVSTSLVTKTTSVVASSTTDRATSPTTTIAKKPPPEIVSKLSEKTFEVTNSVKATATFATKHNGTPSVSVSPTAVCKKTSGIVRFVGSGTCKVTVVVTESSTYLAAKKSFTVLVKERGVSISELSFLSSAPSSDNSRTSDYLTWVKGVNRIDITRPVTDFFKVWSFRAQIKMPAFSPQGAQCLRVYVNYYYNNEFNNLSTPCSNSSTLSNFCMTFDPSVAPSNKPWFTRDTQGEVTLSKFYWSIQWASNPVDLNRSLTEMPIVTVTDIRPGSC